MVAHALTQQWIEDEGRSIARDDDAWRAAYEACLTDPQRQPDVDPQRQPDVEEWRVEVGYLFGKGRVARGLGERFKLEVPIEDVVN